MILIAKILLISGLAGLLHSYIIYPLIIKWLAKGKKINKIHFDKATAPDVIVLMSLYNEEAVIEKKLQTLTNQDYPSSKLHVFIGSDQSDDDTNKIVEKWVAQNAQFHFFSFQKRRGKPSVINDLVQAVHQQIQSSEEAIFIVTDASVLLEKNTIWQLVRHLKNEDIDLVDARMMHFGMEMAGISEAENDYISMEGLLKHREGLIWKKMIGPFGGCYAVRANKFSKIPSNRLVDDFYIVMKIFEKGGGAISDLEAVCYERVSSDIWVEFRRKKRIAAGSFQNMFTFWRLWLPPTDGLGFAFFSHKILRWLGPFFLLVILFSSFILALSGRETFDWIYRIQMLGYLLIPLLDYLQTKAGFHFAPLRKVNYFILMNIALLFGFFKFLGGIKSGAWARTERVSES